MIQKDGLGNELEQWLRVCPRRDFPMQALPARCSVAGCELVLIDSNSNYVPPLAESSKTFVGKHSARAHEARAT